MSTFMSYQTTMRYPLFLLLMVLSITGRAQTETEAVRQTIETFFKGFHDQDSILMKSVVADGIIMQTIGTNKEGKTVLRTADFSNFLKNIVSIPDSIPYREEITSYTINIDGPMANAWTDYRFWSRNSLSHCGVNSFQLANQNGHWRIIYLIDTRRKDGCR